MEMSDIIREGSRWNGNEQEFADKGESDVAMLDDILGDAIRLAAKVVGGEPVGVMEVVDAVSQRIFDKVAAEHAGTTANDEDGMHNYLTGKLSGVTSLRFGIKNALAAREPAPVARDLLEALRTAEAALADIGDADREPGDDVAWCEARAAKALPEVRAAIESARGSGDKANSAPPTPAPATEPSPLYFQALELVRDAERASVSMVQRKLRIGWNEARDMVELMLMRSEIPEAWAPHAAFIGRRAPSAGSAGTQETT